MIRAHAIPHDDGSYTVEVFEVDGPTIVQRTEKVTVGSLWEAGQIIAALKPKPEVTPS